MVFKRKLFRQGGSVKHLTPAQVVQRMLDEIEHLLLVDSGSAAAIGPQCHGSQVLVTRDTMPATVGAGSTHDVWRFGKAVNCTAEQRKASP